MVGRTLGHYEILEPLGKGGMGEVYLAEDPRLGRKVAIKVLPEEFASDPERLARFEQEARAAAALNHPHIAVIHDIGVEGDVHFMVQEYLEGQSLKERLDAGALPIDTALDLSAEISEALVAAHAGGIVHRDLKPDNIFITEAGHAKVLDFGLAKLTEVATPMGGDLSDSPTKIGTVAGQVMGTAGYMAPEQVNGEDVDGRADIFALGCVLYEMTTGRRPFAGENVHDTLNQIISKQPEPLSETRADVPLKLEWIVEKSLAKRPERRYQSAAGLEADLVGLREESTAGVARRAIGGSPEGSPSGPRGRGLAWSLAVPAGVVIAILGAAATWYAAPTPSEESPGGVRYSFELSPDNPLSAVGRPIAVSPDGTEIVYGGFPRVQLYRKSASTFAAAAIEGTEFGLDPFFSPDGEWIGFQLGGNLVKIRASGGESVTLCEECVDLWPNAHWSPLGDTIVFERDRGLWQVPAEGGAPTLLASPNTAAGETSYRAPVVLPGGTSALIELRRSGRPRAIAIVHFDSGAVDVVTEDGRSPRYSTTGHIVFKRGSALYAIAHESGDAADEPTRLLDEVGTFGMSRNGVIAYARTGSKRRAVWVDPGGSDPTPLFPEFRPGISSPTLSPDGTKLALAGEEGLWIHDLTGRPPYLVVEGGVFSPIWTPDGTHLIFEHGGSILRRVPAAPGPHQPEDLPWAEGHLHATGWAPDGRLLLERVNILTSDDVENWTDVFDALIVSPDGDGELEPLVRTDSIEMSPVIAPGGNWLAYVSFSTGDGEIWLRGYPDGVPTRVSVNGGRHPQWSMDGSMLYFREGDRMMAVSIDPGPDGDIGEPRALFSGAYYDGPFGGQGPSYAVGADGRFLMIEQETVNSSINVVPRFEELKREAGTSR